MNKLKKLWGWAFPRRIAIYESADVVVKAGKALSNLKLTPQERASLAIEISQAVDAWKRTRG